jgi:hypothetical protein
MIVSALITAALFYATLWLFERKHLQFDFYDAATVVVAPIIASILVAIASAFLGFGTWGSLASSLVLILVTYLCLTKILSMNAGRAVIYTIAVLFYQTVPALILTRL